MDLDFTDVVPSGPPTSRAPLPSVTIPSPSQALPSPPAKQSATPFSGAPNATPLPSKFKNRGVPALSRSLGARTKSGEANMLPPASRPPQSIQHPPQSSTQHPPQQPGSKLSAAALLGGKNFLHSRASEKGSRSSLRDNRLSRGRFQGRDSERERGGDPKIYDAIREEEAVRQKEGESSSEPVRKARTIYDAEELEGFGGSQGQLSQERENEADGFDAYAEREMKRGREELEDEVDERRKRRNDDPEFQNDEEPAEENAFTHSQSPVLSPSSQPTLDRFHDLAPLPHFHQQQDFSPPASQTLRFVSIAESFPGPSPHLQQADALLVSQKGSKWEECTEEEWKAGGEELSRRFEELMRKVVQVVGRKNARAAEMREVTRGYEKELEEREAKMQGTSKNMKNWAGELWAGVGK